MAAAGAALTVATATLPVIGETYLKSGSPNTNQGGDTVVRLQSSGKNRALLFFNADAIRQAVGSGTLLGASLELTIDSAGNDWGSSGRPIAVHRLKQASAEYSATWNCAIDLSIYNSSADCAGDTAWDMSSTDPATQPWLSPETASATITSKETGTVSLELTADVAAILDGSWPGYGWLLKKVDESASGSVDFKAHEQGQGLGAQLVLQVQGAQPRDAGSPKDAAGAMDAAMDAAAMDAGSARSATVVATADTYVRKGAPNQNEGADAILRIQASGRNRALLDFDGPAIASALAGEGLRQAHLELTISKTFDNWGPDRVLGVHRMLHDWSELGATWNCSVDTDTSNSSPDCGGPTAWSMWKPDLPDEQVAWNDPPSGTALIASGETGVVRFDVTRDVACYLEGFTPFSGFLVKKEAEQQAGHIEFTSRETATPPLLVLEHAPGSGVVVTAADCTREALDGGTPDAGMDGGACVPTGNAELSCDGLDDDCDGKTDEDYEVTVTSCGVGACSADGELSCIDGAEVDSCVAGTPAAGDDTCDGVDDDCNGAVDDGYAGAATSCGSGACAATGTLVCLQGQVHDTCVPLCESQCADGLDNDGDGQVDCADSDCAGATGCAVVGSPCTSDADCVGLATPEEPAFCALSLPGGYCVRPCDPAASPSTCPEGSHCEGGACFASCDAAGGCAVSTQICSAVPDYGVTTPFCRPTCAEPCPDGNYCDPQNDVCQACLSDDTTCDGVDQDCDGRVDEEFVAETSTCGVGACLRTGTTACVNGEAQTDCTPGTPAPSDTTCDGIDDNCSGTADEGYVPVATSCGVGACSRTGTTACVAGTVSDGCVPGNPAAADASCDGIDDDCDGHVDEEYVSESTSCGLGACMRTGATSCVNGTVQTACAAGPPAGSDTSCDGIDNNCDGTADEGYVPVATSCGVGACARTAMSSCVNGEEQSNCVPGTPAASDTTCDGVDDDCNGIVDDGYVPVATSCGVGGCARSGTSSCVNGAVQIECAPGAPAASDATCDGVDDDCNGTADDGYVPVVTSCGVGACARSAMSSCAGGLVQSNCSPGTPAASDSTCNGIDDNCDGTADEGYVSLTTSCGVGACGRLGSTFCVAGVVGDTCTPGNPAAADATCDGNDDDCDGIADEDYAPVPTSCGVGACARAGATSCVLGTVADSCAAAAPAANDATCDGLDDDCDGTVDEDYVAVATSCGVGQCASTGSSSCSNGMEQDSCVPGTPAASDTTCDGADDDCNGQVDDGYVPRATSCGTGACANTGSTSCVNGVEQDDCTPGGVDADTTCNGLDDDCDGKIDEAVVGLDDGEPCTIDSCDPATGIISHQHLAPGASCSDGNVCNGAETCQPPHAQICAPTVGGVVAWWPGDGNAHDVIGGHDGTPQNGLTFAAAEVDQGFSFDGVDDQVDLSAHAAALNLAGQATLEMWVRIPTDTCRTIFHLSQDATHEQYLRVGNGCGVTNSLVMWTYVNGGTTQTATVTAPSSLRSILIDAGRFHHLALTFSGSGAVPLVYIDGTQVSATPSSGTTAAGQWGGFPSPVTATLGSHSGTQYFQGMIDEITLYDHVLTQPQIQLIANVYGGGKCKPTVCTAGPPPGAGYPCDDGDHCRINDQCDGASRCLAGSVVPPDSSCDGVDDDCDGTADEDYVPTPTSCGTGECTNTGIATCVSGQLQDSCVPGAQYQDDDCNGHDDDCDNWIDEGYVPSCLGSSTVTCVQGQVVTTSCADADLCNGQETCESGTCQPGTPPVVDDANPCTTDSCAPASGVSHVPVADGSPCGDGDACNGQETCQSGQCQAAVPPTVDDGDPCSIDTCDPAVGVVHTPAAAGTSCSDGNVCNGEESCELVPLLFSVGPQQAYLHTVNGSTDAVAVRLADFGILPGQQITLTAVGHVYGGDGYVNDLGAVFSSTSELRPADQRYRVPGAIASGLPQVVTGTTYFGGEQTDIAEDFRIPTSGVAVNVPQHAAYLFLALFDRYYADNTAAGEFDAQVNVAASHCGSGTPLVTDDGNVCTADTCDPVLGIAHTPLPGAPCDDANACTVGDSCDSAGTCQAGAPLVIDDGDPCTIDSCDPATGAVHTAAPEGADCSDGNACNGAETCGTPTAVEHFEQVNPRTTFLNFHALYARAYRLSDFGLQPGDRIALRAQGSFAGTFNNGTELLGIFSSTDELLPPGPSGNWSRVPGAIASDAPPYDIHFYIDNRDIADDFRIQPAGVVVTVPEGAVFLFIGANDESYGTSEPFDDNADLDGDFGLVIARDVPPVFGCQPGQTPQIDDGDACTSDRCDEAQGVLHDPNPQGVLSCTQLGAECGQPSDGCGGTLDCGTCPSGQVCGSLETGKCGPPPLQVTPVIHVSRGVNRAHYGGGARVVEYGAGDRVLDPSAATPLIYTSLKMSLGSSPEPRYVSVRLAGADQPVFDEVSLQINEGGADHAELWVSSAETFDLGSFVKVGEVVPPVDGAVDFQLAPVQARYVRLVFERLSSTDYDWGGYLSQLNVSTRSREGGVVSLLEGGADVVRASTETRSGWATGAFDYSHQTVWQTGSAGEQWAVLALAPAGQAVSQLEMSAYDVGKGTSAKDFDLQLSNTGSADGDFSTVLAQTSWEDDNGDFVWELAPTRARYARLRLHSSYGGGTYRIADVRLYSPELGGAQVPFEDMTPLPQSEVASRLWTFGDGASSTERYPSHTYAEPGTYQIALSVTDVQGRVGVAHATYTVLQAPVPDFTWTPDSPAETDGSGPFATLFDASRVVDGQRVLSRSWSGPVIFDDCTGGCLWVNGAFAQADSPLTVRFPQDGDIPLHLTVTDSQFLTASIVKSVPVHNVPPEVNAGPDIGILWGQRARVGHPGEAVMDHGDDEASLHCVWDFGDGHTVAIDPCNRHVDTQRDHVYADPGVYTASLTAFDDHTSTTDTAIVTVDRRPSVVVPLTMVPTAADGDFELSARLFDALDNSAPVVGREIVFSHNGEIVTAVTDADSVARAVVHFDPLSLSTVEYGFAGDDRYYPNSDSVDFEVRQGDSAPTELGQSTSGDQGVRFVLAFPQNANAAYSSPDTRRLVLMISSRVATTAHVRAPSVGFEADVGVAPDQVSRVVVPDTLRMGGLTDRGYNVGDSGLIEDKGIEVTSLDEIRVQALDRLWGSSDAYLALPVERLGSEYLVLAAYNEKEPYFGSPSGSQLSVAAIEDDTQVTIVPTAEVAPGPDLPQGAPIGVPFTVTLNALQTLQLEAGSVDAYAFEDFTGTRVSSSKPVAVYGGHVCTPLSSVYSACDHLIEQMPPVTAFGTRFPIVPAEGPQTYGDVGDIVRVMAGADGTEVRVDGQLMATLDRGAVYQFREGLFSGHEVITSQPSLVGQYILGAGFNNLGDPSFMLVPPADQFVDHLIVSPPEPTDPLLGAAATDFSFRDHLSIIAKSTEAGGIRVDGQPVPGAWRALGDGTYAGARMPLEQGSHVITSDILGAKFMASSYGYEYYGSYAMPVGMQLAQPACRPTVTVPGDGIDNDCDGIEGEERKNGIDDDGDGVPDEDLALEPDPNAANHAPVVFSTSYGGLQDNAAFALPGYDPDGDALTYRVTSGPAATLNGNVLTGPSGVYTIVANDGELDSQPATLSLGAESYLSPACRDPLQATVNRCNERPYFRGSTLVSQVIKVPPGQVVPFVAQVHAFDWDLQPIRYELPLTAPGGQNANLAPGMALDPDTGVFTWLVDSTMAGSYHLILSATDSLGGNTLDGSVTLTVMTDASNAPPVFDSQPVVEAQVGDLYLYNLAAHDPENQALSYDLVTGPAGMTLSGNTLSWTPADGNVGEHTVLVRVSDAGGAAAVQAFTVSVLGSPLRFASTPSLLASVGAEYRYQPEVVRLTGQPQVTYDFDQVCMTGCAALAPKGMALDPATGEIFWTPTQDQLGTHGVVLIARDELGNVDRQFFNIEVLQNAVTPRITSTAVTHAVVHGHYRYDVDAADLGTREVLSYTLLDWPQGMTIDMVTGLIEWQPDALGSYAVTVQVTDSGGLQDTQSFTVEVTEDSSPPVLDVNVDQETIVPGGTLTLTALASDEVGVSSLEVTIDGAPAQLDENGQLDFSSSSRGVHTVVVTAVDASGNVSTKTLLVGVQDAGDTTPPVVAISTPAKDAEATYLQAIVGTASDPNLMGYTLEQRRTGESSWTQVAQGYQSVQDGALGTLDATLLRDGYYELRLTAHDVNGQSSEVVIPVRVEGQAKVGVVQLSFVDMAVPMAGIPITVVRSYDSRDKNKQDFGYGWRLDVKQGSLQHNRAPGSEWFVTYPDTPYGFNFPCTITLEHEQHLTEVRLSEREWYLFRATLVPSSQVPLVSGQCAMTYSYEQVDGSTAGAQLLVVGNDQVLTQLQQPPIGGEAPYGVDAVDALDPTQPYNPGKLQLQLADGRVIELSEQNGIELVQDRNGNAISIDAAGIHHSGGKSISFERDAQGRISAVVDPSGRAVQYAYDLNGNLARVTNQVGEATRFSYRSDLPHHLQSIIDAAGRKVAALSYDGDGRLSGVCDAEGGCSQSSYDLPGRSVVQTDATSRPVQYEYDARGNVTKQTDALGNSVLFSYDAQDNLIRAEGPDGSVASYSYDGSKNLLSRVLPHEAGEDPADFTYNYTYTAKNDRASVTLPSGAVIAYEYDAAGNQTAVKDGAGNVIESRSYNADGTLSSKTGRFGTVAYSGYEGGQPTQEIDAFGQLITMSYDAAGHLLSRSERGLTTTMSYDGLGRLSSADYGHGATVSYEYSEATPGWTAISGPTFGRVERSFTAAGRLGSWTEPNGDELTRIYDAAGRVKEEIDALGNSTLYAYDLGGRLQGITDATLNATTTFERDSAGRVTRTTDALGHETQTSYKLGGRLASTTNARGKTTSFDRSPLSASITDALSRTTVTSLSTYGLPGSTTYPGGADTSSSYLGTTRLDGSQQYPTSFQDELERTRNYGYDTKSGLTSATDLAGQSWQYQYTPAAGSGVSYDVFSGNVSTANHDGGASAYQGSEGSTEYRDVSTVGSSNGGNFTHLLSQVTSPKGEVTKFERGTNGRISKVTYPDMGTRTITYDADARPQQIVLPQGTVVTLRHDISGRETHRETDTGEFRDLTYGPGDRIETMTDQTGTTTYHYDAAGRFSGITYPSGGSVMYDRDVLDRTTDVRVKTTPTSGEIHTHYDYDANGNLAQIVDPNGGVTGYSYDDADRLQQRVLPNGVVTTYAYDSRDRVLSVVHKNASNVVLASVVYERSPSGEPTKITREDGTYTKIDYDSALRVKKESHFDANDVLVEEIQYGYDADGNRTSKTTLTGQETYSYAAGFKLTGITGTAGNEVYAHDAGGRLTGIDRGGVHRDVEYDSMDHITRVVDGGIEVERYTFDGMGRRVAVNNGASVKRFLIAPNLGDGYESPQAVVDGSGNLIASYVYAGEHPIMKIGTGGQVEYLLADSMGSVIGKADGSGASTASIHYDGFGNVASAVGASSGIDPAVGAEPRFQGMTLDGSTGLYFVRARSYDSRTGRFVSRDPVGGITLSASSLHPYTYVSNSPTIARDPTGTFTLIEVSITAGIVGVLASISTAIANRDLLAKGKYGEFAGTVAFAGVTGAAAAATGGVAGGIIFGSLSGVATDAVHDMFEGGVEKASENLTLCKFTASFTIGIAGGVLSAGLARATTLGSAIPNIAELGWGYNFVSKLGIRLPSQLVPEVPAGALGFLRSVDSTNTFADSVAQNALQKIITESTERANIGSEVVHTTGAIAAAEYIKFDPCGNER